MKKKVLLSIFIILISFLQNSCSSKRISKKIIVASSGKIESLDPARANTLKSIQLISSLGDTLYELNSNGKLIPELASGMPIISKDRLQIIINLRKNVFFHDGTSLNSKAIKITFDRFKKIGTMKRFVIDFDLHISERREVDAMTADEAEDELNHILSCGDEVFSAFDGDVKIASIEEVE